MKKVAILQSNYIPWKGYFDIINNSDVFVFMDDAQYTKNDWRNRNKIKTATGAQWLTIPVKISGKFGQRISETEINSNNWWSKHSQTIKQNYSKSPFFSYLFDDLDNMLRSFKEEKSLSVINQSLIQMICKKMGIATKITNSTDYFSLNELDQFSSNERILSICQKENATTYISGQAARSYIDTDLFSSRNIAISWTDYSNYPMYTQLYGEMVHEVSVIDLIFNNGKESLGYLKGSALIGSSD